MRFVTWLLDQQDTGGTTARFSKLAWDDVNNGCASPRFTAQEWIEHFKDKHEEKADILTEMLFTSFVEYTKENKQ